MGKAIKLTGISKIIEDLDPTEEAEVPDTARSVEVNRMM